MKTIDRRAFSAAEVALALRVGLGAVFVTGGWFKLSRLLDPAAQEAMVAWYLSPVGYINAFFQTYLFDPPLGLVITPWGFLTALSTFELLSGLALMAGFLVRPLALIYGFLLWTFVIALPVTVSPGATLDAATYESPALLVQIRDIGLSGLCFVLFNLGAGAASVDRRLFGRDSVEDRADWQGLSLLTRLSVAAPLVVGGLFAGLDHIQSFATWPPLLVGLGVLLIAGVMPRAAAVGVVAVMVWYSATKISLDASLITNLNGFKREFAYMAAGAVLALYGAGTRYTPPDIRNRLLSMRAGDRAVPGIGPDMPSVGQR